MFVCCRSDLLSRLTVSGKSPHVVAHCRQPLAGYSDGIFSSVTACQSVWTRDAVAREVTCRLARLSKDVRRSEAAAVCIHPGVDHKVWTSQRHVLLD